MKKVVIDRETDSSVWIEGRRHAKMSECSGYFDTFADAKQYLSDYADERLRASEAGVNRAKQYVDEIGEIENLFDLAGDAIFD